MAVSDGVSVREAKRLQTRERLLGAAIAEFKRAGMAEADVGTIVAAAGVAHGTFFFHFPTKEHVLLEMEHREEERMAGQFSRFVNGPHDLAGAYAETVRLVLALERRLGGVLFKNLLALTSRRRGHPPRVPKTTHSSSSSHERSSWPNNVARWPPRSRRSTAPCTSFSGCTHS